MRAHLIFSIAFAILFSAGSSHAMSLRVAPVLLDVLAPARTAQLTLKNGEPRPMTVQMRIFRWSQRGGQEVLEPTDDVVASPPMITLPNAEEYVVRIIRVSNRPIAGEESYRLIVDEVPDMTQKRNGTISFVLRQSIPVFFSSPEARPAQVRWSISREKEGFLLSAVNIGEKRLRVSKLALVEPYREAVSRRDGLVGYVLGASEVVWKVPASHSRASQVSALQLVAESESEPINATPFLRPAR